MRLNLSRNEPVGRENRMPDSKMYPFWNVQKGREVTTKDSGDVRPNTAREGRNGSVDTTLPASARGRRPNMPLEEYKRSQERLDGSIE